MGGGTSVKGVAQARNAVILKIKKRAETRIEKRQRNQREQVAPG